MMNTDLMDTEDELKFYQDVHAILDAIEVFKEKAVRRGRLTPEETRVEDSILLDNLHLIDEDGYLIRAAMPVFYKDPEK